MKNIQKIMMAISVHKKKTKAVVFTVENNQEIKIHEVYIVNKLILKKKIKAKIKDLITTYNVNEIIIATYPTFNNIELESIGIKIDRVVGHLFGIFHSLKYIKQDELNKQDPILFYIKNGWSDFSDYEHIDINGLVLYMVNHKL
ncbi:MAG: hypothetical protein DRG78_05180 [Epsilonproteobacteria bacterium]|nr:MAG: hypothetical protein DRG78_05180 [Campylobacterota bacterium]